MNLGSAADSLGSSADSDLVEVEPSAGPSSAGQASSSSYAYGDSAGVAEDAPARMPPLVRNASWLSEEPSSSASSSLSGRPRRPSSSSSSTVNTRRRASRGQIEPPTSPGAKPSSRKSILRGTREATSEDQDVSSAASRNRSNSSGGRPNRPDSRESGSTFLHDSETTHRNRSASGPYPSSMLAEGASPRSQMNALWESKDAYGSPSSWTTSRRPSAASSGAGSRGGRRRGSSAAMSSSATEEEHEAPPPLPRLDRERIGSTSSTASSLSRIRRQDLDVASTDSVNGLLKAPPTMMRRLRSKSSRESFNNEGSSEREESKSAPSTLGKLFGGLRKSKSSGQRDEITPQESRADGVAGNPFGVAAAAASPSGLAAPSPSAGRDGEEGRAAASSSSSTDESGARGKNSSSTTSSDDYYSSFQSPRSLASHPYAIPQPTVPSAQHYPSEEAHTRTTTTTTTTPSSPPRANGLQTADPDWTAPTPTNATFAIHAEAQQQQQGQQQQQHSPSSTADQQQQSPTQRAMVRRSGSWPPRGDKKQSSFVTLQNGQSRGVGGSRFQNAASHHPRTPSPNALAFADATASQHGAASSMVASASASSNATQTTTTETSASVHADNDDQPSPLIGVGQGSPQLSASMDQEERRKARRARKHLRSRPQSGQSVSSWHIPLPRSSSLRSYDGGETGPFPTPPPRSSSSSQQGFDFGSYDGAGLSSSPKQQQLSVDAASPLPSPRSPPSRPAPQPPLTASGSASKVAQLASKFGGSTKLQAAPRASPEVKAPAQSYFDRLARYRGPFNALATSPPTRSANDGPPSGAAGDSMSSAEVAAWVNTANGQDAAAPAPRDEDPPTIPSRGRAPSTTSIYEDAPQTLPSRNPSSSDGRAANRAASESTHAASSADSAVTALSARPDRPVKSSRRPGTAQTLETSHRSDPLQPLSSTKRSSGVAIVEGAPQNDAKAPATGPVPSTNALGVSPLRSSVEMAARMGGTFDMTEQHARSAGAAGLAEPLVLSTSRDRSASSHGVVNHREEANVDEALQLEEEEYGDEVAEELGDVDEDENGRLEVPTTPGRRKGSFAARAKNLRKVTPPALASAFRQRKSSAGGEGTLRAKKWPFGAKDEQSEAEEERQQPRSARASMRKKKDVTPARPQIRRVWDDEAAQLSPEDKVSGMLAPKPSIASFQSGASSLQDPAALSAEGGGERSSSSVPPSPAIAGRSRTPPLAWTKGELDGETKRILKRRNVIRELVHTERSYASDLAVIRDVYLARARAKLGSWPSPSPGTPWSTFSAGSPLNHPGSATSSTSFLPYRNAAASRGYFRSASGEVALGSHSQLQAISPSLHRKASSPAMATPPMVFDAKLHPMPSPAPSGTISNRSSVVTSGSKSGSKAESISSDATRSSSRPTDATSKSASEDRSGAAATDAAGMPATPPMITTSTSTTSTFQDAHTHMASLISRGAAGSSGAGDGTPPAGERPAVTIDTRSSASTPGAVINNDAPLSFSDIRVIFAGVEACTAFADEMTNLLEGSMGTLATNSLPADAASLEDTNDDLIGLAFRQLSARIQQVYGAYCSKHEASIARLRDVTTSSPRAAQFFKECTAVARRRTNAWDLASLLIKPVQRMLKYPLLLKQILAATPSTHPDYENLVAAIEEIQRVADSINELNRRREIITQIIGAKPRGVNGNGSAMGSASSSARNVSGGSSVDAAGSGTTSGITRSMTSSKLASSKTLRRKGQGSTPTIATDLAAVGPNVLESTQLPGLLAKFNSLQAGVERLATEYSRWPTLLRASIASQLDLLSAWRIVYACKTERETVHEMERESEQLAAFAALCQEMLEGPWAKLDRAVQLSLLPNMEKVRAIFAGPREVMMRRDEREEDYVKYRALLLAKGEQGMKASSSSSLDSSSQHRRLVESANGFAALHLHLVDELPEFLLGVECMIDALVAAFARIQTEYLGSVKGIMDGFFQGRAEGAASSPAIGATASSAEVASNASHGTSGTVASGRERTAAIVRNWWSAHQTWAMQVEGLRVCQSGSSSGDSEQQRPTMLGEMKKSGSYSFEKSGAGPGVSSIAGTVMGLGSPTTSRRSLPRISGGSTSGPSGVPHSSSTDTPSPLMNMQHSTSSVSLSQDGSSSASSSYLTPGNMSTAGRLSVNGANGGGYRSNGALDVAPGSGGPSPAGSRKGSILRSLSGTLRGGHPADADGPRGESPLPPLPPLPATPVGGLPVPPPKDNRLAASRSAGSATAPPMLPTLDLGAGDLSPEVTARALDNESQISPAVSTNGGRLPSLEAAANGNVK